MVLGLISAFVDTLWVLKGSSFVALGSLALHLVVGLAIT